MRIVHCFIFFILLFPGTVAVSGQTGPGGLGGIVADGQGKPIAGATVRVRDEKTGLELTAQTGPDGGFRFRTVSGNAVSLTVSADGFAPVTRRFEVVPAYAGTIPLEPAPFAEVVTVVSGSRQEELRESLNTKVDVIGRSRIRDTGNESVAEVLQELPGFLTRRGTQGAGAAGEQVQGIDSRQVLVLFDGQPLVGARGIKRGAINLDRQSVNALERIEVVKGASSALYGSDAIGGVVNQISRDPSAPFQISFVNSGGSLGRLDTRGDFGFARERWFLFVSGERHKQNPFDLTRTTFDTTGAGFNRYDGFVKSKLQFNPRFSVTGWVKSYWADERGRSVGEEGNQESFTGEQSQNYNAQADWQVTDRLSVQARGYFARYDENTTGTLFPTNRPLAPGALYERYGKIDGSLAWVVGDRQLVQAGAEWVTDRYRGINRLANDAGERADTASVWAQDRVSFAGRVNLTVGLRFDRHSIFGGAVSPKAGINVRVTDGLRVRASYGRGFRAPDLGQLYYRFLNPTNFYQVIGNPNLRPEYADSIQAGAEYTTRNRRLRLGVNFFHNRIDDLIDSFSLGFVATSQQLNAIAAREGIDLTRFRPALGRLLFIYRNLSNVRTRGLEVDGDANLPYGFNVGGAYTFLSAENRATNQPLAGRHPHQGTFRVAWESNRRIGVRANLRGTFYSSWIQTLGTPNVVAPKFALWDVYAAKTLPNGVELFGAVDNLANSRDPNSGRFAANGSPLPIYRPEFGRTFRIGVRFTWARER
jgi:outer membrane receptor for ferrienterochelin and colicins